MRSLVIAAFLLLSGGLASADVFVLDDGRRIEGKVARETATSWFVETGVGELEIKKGSVKQRIAGKTARETFDDMLAAAKTAEDFFAAGRYAGEQKLKSLATKAHQRAVELDPRHAGANQALGNVLYKDEWMTPAERDRRQAADEESEMLSKGLVRWNERWVTPDEKAQLERGLVQRNGKWITEADAKRLDGLE